MALDEQLRTLINEHDGIGQQIEIRAAQVVLDFMNEHSLEEMTTNADKTIADGFEDNEDLSAAFGNVNARLFPYTNGTWRLSKQSLIEYLAAAGATSN
ncbi:Uncharacterised protein [Mycobacteroides abscessus subsp. abscessus]|uniref:hypothetical protein n=1 Tax=Mycobacteroides abscessus TaxID=36809 RepID=UPI0009273C48|nr:hypothetical protein [Mycobacteroides abscessus]SIH39125.1 Uncharacterised protein [Mycobacteroides abscessus subsp. abscessus]